MIRTRMGRFAKFPATIIVWLALATACSYAQTSDASVTGTITDASGAVSPLLR